MAEKPPLFTVTDRRKFTTDGALRDGRPAEPEPAPVATLAPGADVEKFATPETASTTAGPGLHLVGAEGKVDQSSTGTGEEAEIQSRNPGAPTTETASDGGLYDPESEDRPTPEAEDDGLGPAPTAAETAQQNEDYRHSSDLIDTMVKQANPGAPPAVQMDFEQLVQSIYLSAVVAMGAGGEPGQKPRIDIIGARQSIDMLAVLGDKTRGNLTEQEQRLLQNALFNLRMMFLEITNALAAQAQRPPAVQRPPQPGPRK